MKKLVVGAALAASVMGVGGTAFAGETGGNGELTPINSYRAGSICSFSGLNDDPNSPDPFEDGQVQNWGTVLGDAKIFFGDGKGASAISHEIRVEGPGTNCQGYASQGG